MPVLVRHSVRVAVKDTAAVHLTVPLATKPVADRRALLASTAMPMLADVLEVYKLEPLKVIKFFLEDNKRSKDLVYGRGVQAAMWLKFYFS